MKNKKILILLFGLFFNLIFSQNYLGYIGQNQTINVNSGVSTSATVKITCYGNQSGGIWADGNYLCTNDGGYQISSYAGANGTYLSPGQSVNFIINFKKTVTTNQTFVYKFSTKNANCNQAESEMIKITVNYIAGGGGSGTICDYLPKPTNLQLTNLTYNSASISWSPVPGATQYRVRYYLKNTMEYNNLRTSGTSFTFYSLLPNTAYQADVSPICPNGNIDGIHVTYIKFDTPCATDLTINYTIRDNQSFQAMNSILASSNINDNLLVDYSAKNQVYLLSGFNVKASTNSSFRAFIKPSCSIYTAPPPQGKENDSLDVEGNKINDLYSEIGGFLKKKNKNVDISNSEIKVYPNPVSSYFNIDTGKEKIISWQLYDYSGKIIKKGNSNTINVQSIPNASYVLKINLEKTQISKTIIVKH